MNLGLVFASAGIFFDASPSFRSSNFVENCEELRLGTVRDVALFQMHWPDFLNYVVFEHEHVPGATHPVVEDVAPSIGEHISVPGDAEQMIDLPV